MAKSIGEEFGVVFWWSTFYQRWNRTEWKGTDDDGRGPIEVVSGSPIVSDEQLIKRLSEHARRTYPNADGKASVIESGYSAAWCTSDEYKDFLSSKVEWLVCHEL